MLSTIHANFAEDDAQQSTIIGIWGSPQDPEVWKNQGAMPSDDARYVQYFNAQPKLIREFMIKPGE